MLVTVATRIRFCRALFVIQGLLDGLLVGKKSIRLLISGSVAEFLIRSLYLLVQLLEDEDSLGKGDWIFLYLSWNQLFGFEWFWFWLK